MNQAIKGAILSGLVFPGLGQLALGSKGVGGILILGTNIGLAGIIISVFRRIPLILAQIEPELAKGSLNFDRLLELSVGHSSVGSGSLLENISVAVVFGCWLFSVIHAWRLGSKQQQAEKTAV